MKASVINKMNYLKPIFTMVAAVHHVGTMKYEPQGWEREPFRKLDSSYEASLDAILRHTNKLCQAEDYEEQSKLPHIAHVMCRTQMALTAIIRGDLDLCMDDGVTGRNLTPEYKKQIKDFEIHLEPCVEKYLTPEFIDLCMQLDPDELNKDQVGIEYQQFKGKQVANSLSVHRTWLAIFMKFLLNPSSDDSTGKPEIALKNNLEFLTMVIKYCLFNVNYHRELLTSCEEVFNQSVEIKSEDIPTPDSKLDPAEIPDIVNDISPVMVVSLSDIESTEFKNKNNFTNYINYRTEILSLLPKFGHKKVQGFLNDLNNQLNLLKNSEIELELINRYWS